MAPNLACPNRKEAIPDQAGAAPSPCTSDSSGTPACSRVGGKDGRLIGNMVAYHMKSTLNWGLAASMGVILLVGILVLYWIYDKIVGIDNMKMG